MGTFQTPLSEEEAFTELRRKIRHSEVLSNSTQKLVESAHFSGKISIIVQNGRVLKSGYEEGYFTARGRERLLT